MPQQDDVNLLMVLRSLRKHLLLVIGVTLLFGFLGYLATTFMDKKYGYAAMIQIIPPGDPVNLDPAEVLAMINFNFGCDVSERKVKEGCVDLAAFPENTKRILKLHVASESLENATAATEEIIRQLRSIFEKQISQTVELAKSELLIVNEDIESLQRNLKELDEKIIKASAERLDLAMQRNTQQKELGVLKKRRVDLQSSMQHTGELVLRAIDMRPISRSPIFPRVRLIIALSAITGFGLALMYAYVQAPRYAAQS